MKEDMKRRIEEEERKRRWREMWEHIGRLTHSDTSTMANLPEFGR